MDMWQLTVKCSECGKTFKQGQKVIINHDPRLYGSDEGIITKKSPYHMFYDGCCTWELICDGKKIYRAGVDIRPSEE